MPTRGYRKGISDSKVPVTKPVKVRVSEDDYLFLQRDASSRSLTMSKLMRKLISAHAKGARAQLPQSRGGNTKALRELSRIGNNLNQLARQAHTGIVPVSALELQQTLRAVHSSLKNL